MLLANSKEHSIFSAPIVIFFFFSFFSLFLFFSSPTQLCFVRLTGG